MSKQGLLSAEQITVWRGETCVLDEVSAEINAGDVCQVSGPNGSGKTTYQAELLYLGHKPGISGALTPKENLTSFLKLRQATPDLSALDKALTELELGERIDLPCRWLSAGQQRRVALARLSLEPASLWILDEPLNALDVNGVQWVVDQIQAQANRGGAVMFTTHQVMPFKSTVVNEIALGDKSVLS